MSDTHVERVQPFDKAGVEWPKDGQIVLLLVTRRSTTSMTQTRRDSVSALSFHYRVGEDLDPISCRLDKCTRSIMPFLGSCRDSGHTEMAPRSYHKTSQGHYLSFNTPESFRASCKIIFILVYNPRSSLSHLPPFGNIAFRNLLTQ